MSFNLILFDNQLLEVQAVSDILSCNQRSQQYALSLTEKQALELVETRTAALKNSGRIEFGAGIIGKLIAVFCDSPYLSQNNYEQELHDLIEIFYYFKNETLDLMSDDDLLAYMKKYFNGVCDGDLDLLKSRELERIARNVRLGNDPDYNELAEERQQQLEMEAKENESYR